MLAGGTGISPMIQIIRAHLLYERKFGLENHFNLDLIYACGNESELVLREVIAKHETRHPFLRVYYSLLKPPPDWKMGVGFINKDMILERMPKPGDDMIIVICGPPPFCKAMIGLLDNLGYQKRHYYSYL